MKMPPSSGSSTSVSRTMLRLLNHRFGCAQPQTAGAAAVRTARSKRIEAVIRAEPSHRAFDLVQRRDAVGDELVAGLGELDELRGCQRLHDLGDARALHDDLAHLFVDGEQ